MTATTFKNIMTRPSHRSSASNTPRQDYDVEYSPGYLDESEFKSYVSEFRKAIAIAAKTDRGAMVAEIHRAMNGAAQPRMSFDAIESLLADQLIRQVGFVTPLRFVCRHERQIVKAHAFGRNELEEWI